MRFRVCCLLLLSLIVSSACLAANTDWPMLRHDMALTGRADVKGNITVPEIKDKIFAGAYEGLIVVHPDARAHAAVALPQRETGSDYMTKHTAEWNAYGLFDLPAGDPRLAYADSPQMRYAKVLPDVTGLQQIKFDDAFGGPPELKGHLYAFDTPDGKPREVWTTTKAEDDMYCPLVLFVDCDNDGVADIAVATHYRIMVFDSKTGAKKMELRFHNHRNYGYFGAFYTKGNPYPQFAIIADFFAHLDVVGNDGKKLAVLWRRDVEPSIIRKQKIVRANPNPVADIDGDGRQEMTFSMFDYEADHKWHTYAFDALTGKLKFNLGSKYLRGLADANNDGRPDLFLEATRGLAVPKFGPVSLISYAGGKQNILWSHDRAAWQTTVLAHLPLTSNTAATDGSRTVLLGKRSRGVECYAVTDTPGAAGNKQTLLALAQDSTGKYAPISSITAPSGADIHLKAIHQNKSGYDLLVGIKSSDSLKQALQCDKAKTEVVAWRPVASTLPVATCVHLRPNEAPTVIFQNDNEQIIAMQKVRGAWKTRWRQAGRGMSDNAPNYQGFLSADVNGDGQVETLFARLSLSGEAELVAVNPDGKQVWSHVFTGFDGIAPIWNYGGLTYWTVGHFSSKDHMDVFCSLRRSTMHSDEGFCISGVDGHQLWHKEAAIIPGMEDIDNTRGYAGVLIAAADMNKDGLDELVCEFPDRYWVANGKTGEMITIVNTASGIFPKMWCAYATPMVMDFRGEGTLQALWGSNSYVTALLTADGKPIWYGKYMDGPTVAQGLASCDASGKIRIGGDGYKDGFRCYDPMTGDVKWTYPAGDPGTVYTTTAGPSITADVDGDGLQEFVFVHDGTLYALNGKDDKANVVWSLKLPTTAKYLAWADVDGDGKPELLFGGRDGFVYAVGQK